MAASFQSQNFCVQNDNEIRKKKKKKNYLDHFPLTLPPFIFCESPNLLLIKGAFLAEPLGLPREDAGFMQLEL